MSNSNLYAHFQRQFEQHADKHALVTTDGTSWTYSELEAASARMANLMKEIGLSVGDRVSVQVHKSPQVLCLYLACLRSGLVYHPLNIGYKPSELEYFIGNALPSAIVTDPAGLASFESLANAELTANIFTLDEAGEGSLITASTQYSSEHHVITSKADDLAALLYSSGTTGLPKGIMLSHSNLLRNTEALVDSWAFREDDVLLHALPVFHVHGLFVALGCVFLSGASMRWLDKYDPQKVCENLSACSVLMGVPTYYTRLLDCPAFTAELASKPRLYISGSAPLLEETFMRFEQHSGHRILERYGMTETNMNTSNPLDGERRAGTVGFPLPGVQVRIVDEQGNNLPAGKTGALQVKGDNVFQGYWKMPEKTAEDFTADGFFNTGDEGVIDTDGYVSIVGRAKDMIITGGLNVYPKELELIIDKMQGVQESAVIGVPHSDFGEAVIAVVVIDSSGSFDQQVATAILKERVAGFKVPKQIIEVEALPRNTMGKVQKNILREQFEGILAAS